MADVGVYMIVNLTITDKDTYRKYEQGFFPMLKKYGGSFVTFDDDTITLEGHTPNEGRVIIFRFPSETAALDWYKDADYQILSEFRRAGTDLRYLTLVHELPPRT